MMHSGFWFGLGLEDFLFHNLNISTWPSMVGVCLGTAAVAFFYEALKVFRNRLSQTSSEKGQAIVVQGQIIEVWTHSRKVHLIQTFLNLIQISFGYVLMLIVMSYNAYLAFSVLLGACLGYFLLTPQLRQRVIRSASVSDPDEQGVLIQPQRQQIVDNRLERDASNNQLHVTADIHSLST